MAKWQPQAKVGLNEQIGRRLFDEPMLKGSTGQPSFSGMQINHFEEKRGNEVSLDRLGATGIDRQVKSYLVLRADAAAKTFTQIKRFDGWAVVAAKELENARKEPKLPLFASPVDEPEPNDNLYHAHVQRPDNVPSYMLALQLRHIFTSYGRVERIRLDHPDTLRDPDTWIARIMNNTIANWLRSILSPKNNGEP